MPKIYREKSENHSLQLTEDEDIVISKINKLKRLSGSHSPSIFRVVNEISEIRLKVDACFLSNPYATDLFEEYLNKEIIKTDKLRELLEFYPSQNQSIAEQFADSVGVHPSNLFISNGAIESIQAIIHNYTRKILVPIPTFSPYYEYANNSIEVVYYELDKSQDYQLDLENLLVVAERESADTVVIINPNNPTGHYLNKRSIRSFLDRAKFIDTVIIDESFIPFAYEADNFTPISMANLVKEYPNVIIVKSMSKDFGIAGIRLGYSIMPEDRVANLLKCGYLWNINGLAEYFIGLFSKVEFRNRYEEIRRKYLTDTQKFFSELSIIPGIKLIKSYANFALIELPPGVSSKHVTAILLVRYGIYVRNCDDKIGLVGEYIRVAARSKEENNLILKAFKEIFF